MDGASAERGTRAAPLAAAGAIKGPGAFSGAVERACAGLDGLPSVVFAFPSGIDPPELDVGSAAARAGAPIAGMSGNGSIGADGAIEQGCSALALSSAISAGIGVTTDAGADLRSATHAAATTAFESADERENVTLLLFLDTRTGDQAEAVAGAYGVAGPEVPLAGGAGGGAEPFQLAGDRALTHSVVAVVLGSDAPIGLSQVHGCRMI
jgi:hypothetical protein